MRRRPRSLAAQMQCVLVAGDLGDCGSIAGKFKSEGDLHVVPDATRDRIRSWVLLSSRTSGQVALVTASKSPGKSSVLMPADPASFNSPLLPALATAAATF